MEQDIINKIKKLLALAESSNENEAALAFARAQKLMQDYDISMTDISESSFDNMEIDIPVLFRNKAIIVKFINIISETFGIKIIIRTRGSSPRAFTLIGKKERILTAEYAFTILYRSLYNARNRFYAGFKEDLKVVLSKQKELQEKFSLEEVFSLTKNSKDIKKGLRLYLAGYLTTIESKVQKFAWDKEDLQGLDDYISHKFPSIHSVAPRRTSITREEYDVFLRGQRDANSEINLFHGVSGVEKTKIESKSKVN